MILPAAVAALSLFAEPISSEAHPRAPGYGADWRVSCVAGTDEFASNCRATAHVGALILEFATGDSQFYFAVEAPGCRNADRIVERNWWRDELTGLTPRRRRALLSHALRDANEALAARCPELGRRGVKLGAFPDIAVFGDP